MPTSTACDFCFTPEIYRPKITHWTRTTPSQTTRDTFEENYQREQQLLNRRLAKYRVYKDEQFHNHRPLERGKTFWDNWKIVDKGRKKYEPAQEYQPLNPILNTLDNYPKPPPSRKGYVQQEKRLNPVLTPWLTREAPLHDPIISRTASAVPYSPATPSRNGRERFGNYDPIRWRQSELLCLAYPKCWSCRCDWILEPEDDQRRDAAGYLPLKGLVAKGLLVAIRLLAPLGRRHVTADSVRHLEGVAVDLFVKRGKKRIPLPSEQGVYDPIKNAWLVLPENKRICEGQSFSPVSKRHFR